MSNRCCANVQALLLSRLHVSTVKSLHKSTSMFVMHTSEESSDNCWFCTNAAGAPHSLLIEETLHIFTCVHDVLKNMKSPVLPASRLALHRFWASENHYLTFSALLGKFSRALPRQVNLKLITPRQKERNGRTDGRVSTKRYSARSLYAYQSRCSTSMKIWTVV